MTLRSTRKTSALQKLVLNGQRGSKIDCVSFSVIGLMCSQVVMARKKDGSWRFCIDYRRINSVTKRTLTHFLGSMIHLMPLVLARDAYSVQWLSLQAIGTSQSKTTIRKKTAFTTHSGTYQFNVTPFGLTGAPGAFCRAMNDCLREFCSNAR